MWCVGISTCMLNIPLDNNMLRRFMTTETRVYCVELIFHAKVEFKANLVIWAVLSSLSLFFLYVKR